MKTLALILSIFTIVLLLNADLSAQPFIQGTASQDNLVSDQSWLQVENLSDEFEGTSLDGEKWDSRPIVPGKFFWLGRWPGLFEEENIHIREGELWLEAEAFAEPKTDERATRDDWTHGGAIIRSQNLVQPGMYVEAEMRTTETIMSGTFWLTTPAADCNVIAKAELDITESIGIKSGVFKEPELGWYANVADEFEFGINANCRQRSTNCLPTVNGPGAAGTFDPSKDFHVYGMYWESPTNVHFYVDGFYQFSITPPMLFDDPMAIIMALETYDFNYPKDVESDGFNGTMEERSTRYKWVRTWMVDNSTSTETANTADQGREIIKVFPNPVINQQLTIQLSNENQSAEVSIVDTRGVVRKTTKTITSTLQLPVTDLTPGVYFVRVQVANQLTTTKVVIN